MKFLAKIFLPLLIITTLGLKFNSTPVNETNDGDVIINGYYGKIIIPVNVTDRLRALKTQELPDWSQMSPADGYEGTRTLELYDYLKRLGLEPAPITVAVMDSGFEIDHPDLKDNLWNNDIEINGTPGVDDDNNGYIDDFHGWNFLGKAISLNYEVAREFARLKKEGISSSDPYYKKVEEEYKKKKGEDDENYSYLKLLAEEVKQASDVLSKSNITTDPKKLQELSGKLKGKEEEAAQKILGVYMLVGLTPEDILKYEKEYQGKTSIGYDLNFDPSTVIGDNPDVLDEKNYGDNDPSVKVSSHGTHVAGIIGSVKKGIGQAPFVKLMYIRVVPADGDERDKDIANGIRYAADNGASIINLSAGKYFARNAEYVIEAIKYAESKGVLFVVAAGNEATDIQTTVNYPPKFYIENGEMKYFSNLLCVGASTWMKTFDKSKDPEGLSRKSDLCAPFSNYSKNVVDLFSPGMEINSTLPGNKHGRMSGTSMASPNAAGVAAIIKGYFPYLNASQIKDILMTSARKYPGLKVKTQEQGMIEFSELSKTGGVIDAYNAFKLAEQVKQ